MQKKKQPKQLNFKQATEKDREIRQAFNWSELQQASQCRGKG